MKMTGVWNQIIDERGREGIEREIRFMDEVISFK